MNRPWPFFAAACLLGAGCSLINAYDDVVTTGSGGSGAQAGGPGSGGASSASTGGGGSGGGAPQYTCQPFGSVVEILSKAELNNTTDLDENVLVRFDGQGYVHVFVVDNDVKQIIARTVRDDQLGPLIKWPPAPMGSELRAFDAISFGSDVLIMGRVDNDFKVLRFEKSGDELGMNPPTLLNVPVPPACDDPGQEERLWGSFDAGETYLLGVCSNNNTATVFGSALAAGTVNFQFSGPQSHPLYRPSQYLHIGAHVILTAGENPGGPSYGAFLRVGDDAMIPMVQPIPLSLEPGKAPFPFALVRALGNTPAVFALIASLTSDSPTLTPGRLFGGVVQGPDLPAFAMDQAAFLSPAIEFPNQSSIVFTSEPNPAYGRYVSGGFNIFDTGTSKASIQWWSDVGTLYTTSVINELPDPLARHVFVAAGVGNQVFYYVVWVRRDADMQHVVEGTRVQCDVVAQ